jgi:hypothetical protein
VAGLGNRLFQIAAALEVVGGDIERVATHRKNGSSAAQRVEPVRIEQLERFLGHQFVVATPSAHWINERFDGRGAIGRLRQANGRSEELPTIDAATQGRVLRWGGTAYLRGMFQNPDWFPTHCDDLVSRIVAHRPEEIDALVPTEPYSCINVRGGDYRPLGWMLDDTYLLRVLNSGFFDANGSIYVVGDDDDAIRRTRQVLANWGLWSAVLEPVNDPFRRVCLDFWAIAMAQRIVMSNSTFCWWATRVAMFLRPEVTVIYPSGWITGDPTSSLSRSLQLPSWIPVESACLPPALD